jgi:hypothetical protein
MELVNAWTGRTACALQAALRLSNESFAENLGIAVRTVAAWHQKPTLRPKSEMQQLLDTALEQASASVKARFATLVADSPHTDASLSQDGAADAERRLSADPNVGAALDWLDQHAGREPGTSRREVASRLARLDVRELQDRGSRRGLVSQGSIAQALGDYYRDRTGSYGRYNARYVDDAEAVTSILTCADWLDLDCPLITSNDRLVLTSTVADGDVSLDERTAGHAAQRIAETLAMGIRLVDMPLYRLLGANVRKGTIAGSVGLAHFIGYALTMDLLEGELVDAMAAGVYPRHGALPLRDRYLPDLASVLNLSGRLCAGGTLALCAIARPASPYRGEADYIFLVQETLRARRQRRTQAGGNTEGFPSTNDRRRSLEQ